MSPGTFCVWGHLRLYTYWPLDISRGLAGVGQTMNEMATSTLRYKTAFLPSNIPIVSCCKNSTTYYRFVLAVNQVGPRCQVLIILEVTPLLLIIAGLLTGCPPRVIVVAPIEIPPT